ncbi:MAG: STAS domain-containing protein [bacterium]|nr:STAS domain-containing protein [Candidatus Sumerlaeota bacterium]
MNYILTRTSDQAVLALEGHFDAQAASRLRALTSLLHLDPPKSLVIDFDRVSFLGSAGVGVLLLLRKEIQKLEGKMSLVNVSPDIRKVFDLAGLSAPFGL